MVLKLDEIWPTVAGSILPSLSGVDPSESIERGSDPAMADAVRERKRRRQAEQFAHDRDDREKQRDAEREESDMDAAFMESWLASEEYRRAYKELTNSLADARQAALRAYERALQEREEAHQALEEARRNAITLSDGRRVYFSKDGQRLYTEDDREITDGVALAEARSRHTARPDATTYEDINLYRARDKASAANVEHTETILHRINTLQERIANGNLTPAELKRAQDDLRDITLDMAPEVRADYERLQAARKDATQLAYVPADSFKPASDIRTAPHGGIQPTTPDETTERPLSRTLAYKAAPGFGE